MCIRILTKFDYYYRYFVLKEIKIFFFCSQSKNKKIQKYWDIKAYRITSIYYFFIFFGNY